MSKTTKNSHCTSSIRSHLRQVGLSQRNRLSPSERHVFSQRACTHATDYFTQQIADFSQIILAAYWPIRSEIDPRPLFHFVSSQGGFLALPAILDRTTMVFRTFSEEASLESMQFGTFGPDASHAVVAPTIIIVPLSAFDAQCHRLGYGGGYYDRAIAQLKQNGHSVQLFGLGFSCQEVESIPAAEHDLVLQGIFTEKGFLQC
ncbi:5-formyltetrahydrofolate cyclo-ligase [Bartonella sp. F02]|uniref:5-formyltetrahydrofolate cyclo-ligase n=1 Tax=Bartonella sp. F02 TaxID=2967262 RepID=UPI0022A92CD4|nr:5-formyltetrahydrofolate cyclo-ligase [Bartonella sp. F02]MCZ2328862.1 5-formyltetrahydrofolate cyclo-ligase [Bartonella sp. F02]